MLQVVVGWAIERVGKVKDGGLTCFEWSSSMMTLRGRLLGLVLGSGCEMSIKMQLYKFSRHDEEFERQGATLATSIGS